MNKKIVIIALVSIFALKLTSLHGSSAREARYLARSNRTASQAPRARSNSRDQVRVMHAQTQVDQSAAPHQSRLGRFLKDHSWVMPTYCLLSGAVVGVTAAWLSMQPREVKIMISDDYDFRVVGECIKPVRLIAYRPISCNETISLSKNS